MEGKIEWICDEEFGGLRVRRRVFESDGGEEYLSEESYIEEVSGGEVKQSVLVGRAEIPKLKEALTAIYH